MSYEDKDEDQRVVWGVLVGLITLLVGGVIAFAASVGSSGADSKKAVAPVVTATAPAPTPAPVIAPTAPAADAASVVVQNGVVKFYFATGKADLAKGSNEALADVVKGLKAGQKAVISGYHDQTGNLASNQALAKRRAESVRAALVSLGADAAQIELKKPENSAGGGSNAEARRVEVELAK